VPWDFETEPEYQELLDWADGFVRDEVEPLDLAFPGLQFTPPDDRLREVLDPLKQEVRRRGLWATHLGPELGGQGHGQLQLALLNEILGRSSWAPVVFGCQAPDTGNAEIIAHYGTPAQKERYLRPLLDGELFSSYSMTEPHAGADPTLFTTRAERDGDHWVINGEKWFTSNAKYGSFYIVMAVSNPEAGPYERMSQFIVPRETPGVEIVRNVGVGGESSREGGHGYVRYTDVRVPAENLLGGEGKAFAIAQTRLGGGRIHHAMRTIASARKAFDMMCERALSRQVRGSRRDTSLTPLANLQMTQEKIADSWLQIEQFRLLVLRTAWLIDKHKDYLKVRKDIAAVKVAMPTVLHDVAQRALHLHGALGASTEMPFAAMLIGAEVLGIADGPTEVHKVTLAKQVLRDYAPHEGLFPSGHIPAQREAAKAKLAELLEHEAAQV
jgi:acyl-CoA dehydrogenase